MLGNIFYQYESLNGGTRLSGTGVESLWLWAFDRLHVSGMVQMY